MEQKSNQQLFELLYLIYPQSITFEEYKNTCDNDEKLLKNTLISEIEDYLSETNYKGPFEYEPIYYYFKGRDDILTQNKNFLKELPTYANKLKEFHKQNQRHNTQSFQEWMKQESSQNEVVEEIMDHLLRHKLNWTIDFTKLTNTGREMIFEPLKHFFEKHILTIPVIGKYKLKYQVNGDWHSKVLNAETLDKLMKNLEEKHLIYDLDTTPPEYFYEDGGSELPDWSLFDVLQFSEYQKFDKTVYSDRGGSFFGYWNKTYIDLSRYQIFSKGDNYYDRRACIEVPCIIWALKDLIPDDKLNAVALRLMTKNPRGIDEIITNYHNNKDLDFICSEQRIYCKLHYYDEYCEKPQFRIIDRGVDKENAKYHIELALYKQHYFKFEKTQYTRYFIKNYEELKWVDNGNKIVGKRKTGTYKRDSREEYYLNSLELLIEMMNNKMFSEMSFRDLRALTMKINPNTPITDIPLFEDESDSESENIIIIDDDGNQINLSDDEYEDSVAD